MSFATKIEDWYSANSRALPWRETRNPYHIWLSEIILQQTRIEQGMSYYLHFVEAYPTVKDLADASEEQVLKSWQGLGYYSRARNLHATARHIAYDLGGSFPSTYEEILGLKGIGPYTAAAIASFAFRIPRPVIDGNVYRLVARRFGIATPIATPAAYREFEELLSRLIDRERPDLFNQAMMDFGSTYCRPSGPDCAGCIFSAECEAYRTGRVDLLPVRPAPPEVKRRFFYYLDLTFVRNGEPCTLMHCRRGKDIWKGLYEFPLIESDRPLAENELLMRIGRMVPKCEDAAIVLSLTHKLTHRTIEATFVEAKTAADVADSLPDETTILRREIKNVPVSRLIDRYLNK